MTLLLQKISDSIPAPSLRVRERFDQSVTTETVAYGIFTRYAYAFGAIGLSTINTLGYGLAAFSRIPTALIYRDFTDVKTNCLQDAHHVFNSLYFAAAMSTYLFMYTIRWPGYALHLAPPTKPYSLKPEARTQILSTEQPPDITRLPTEVKIEGLSTKIFTELPIDSTIPNLPSFLEENPDLALVVTEDQQFGSIIKRDKEFRASVLSETFFLSGNSFIEEVDPQSLEQQNLANPNRNLLPSEEANKEESTSPQLNSAANQQVSPSSPPPETTIPETTGNQNSPLIQAAQTSKNNPSSKANQPPAWYFSKPPSPVALVKATFNTVWRKTVGGNHIFKEMKYRHVMTHLVQTVTEGYGLELYNAAEKTKESSELKIKCIELYEIITQSPKYDDVRIQNLAFITCLRKAQTLITKTSPEPLKKWVQFLAYHRFAGIELYEYCKSLVEEQTDLPFTNSVTLENFKKELEERMKKIANLSSEEGMAWPARLVQKMLGHFNIKDFLAASNIPYRYADMTLGKQKVTLLRHGTPIEQNDISGTLNVTPDFIAFIEGAKVQDKNILHIIFENAVPPSETLKAVGESYLGRVGGFLGEVLAPAFGGDESKRVKARLELGKQHENFYPLAFRMDGHFVQPKGSFKPKTIEQAKQEFLENMYGQNTGFIVPDKLQKEGILSKVDFTKFMDQVIDTFFKGEKEFKTAQEFQAFIVLTYAEIALSLCQTLKIDYLEAFCKDDIDRGGAIKAIIVLLHLYKSGKFEDGSEEELQKGLEAIMVNLIAAPLIVRKNEIIESRVNYFLNVVEVMKKTVAKAPKPDVGYTGSFTTPSKPHQGLAPIGATCRTKEEYQTYLEQVKSGGIVLQTKLEQNIIELCKQDEEGIKRQLIRDIIGLNMYLNGERINPTRQEDFSIIKQKILTALKDVNIANGTANSILSAFTQTIGSDLTASLKPLFENSALNYCLVMDAGKMLKDQSAGLFMEAKNGKVSIKFVSLCRAVSEKLEDIATIRSTIEIPDHRKAGAIVTTTVD